MALSVRVFGLSSWSVLAPQALLGVATVGVTYASVRRTFERSGSLARRTEGVADGHVAGLVAGALLALTPAAALMFRFDNPDALLVFLMTLAAYVTLRATERASGKTLAWAGVLIGLAFLTKMLQAFLVLPALVLVYLLAAPTTLRKRLLHLLGAFAAMVVSLGWWVAVVELVPASWRPYVGGSTNDSVLDLVFGYNGLARILGRSGSGASGREPGRRGRRLRRHAGPDPAVRAGLRGHDHLAPARRAAARRARGRRDRSCPADRRPAGRARPLDRLDRRHRPHVLADGGDVPRLLRRGPGPGDRRRRHRRRDRAVAALAHLAGPGGPRARRGTTAGWAFVLLGRATGVYASLRWPVLVVGVVAALALLVAHRLPRLVANLVLVVALAGAATGPAAYTLNTVATPHTGSIVTAGPVSSQGGPGGTRGGFTPGEAGRDGRRTFPDGARRRARPVSPRPAGPPAWVRAARRAPRWSSSCRPTRAASAGPPPRSVRRARRRTSWPASSR